VEIDILGAGLNPHPGENIHLPHHLITPADVGLVHAAFEGESSGNYATNVVRSNEAATV
jgi:hypothetical protein